MIVIEAPAKLTLSLRITGVRSDGMHTIDAEMVSLSLADRLDIDPDGSAIAFRGADIGDTTDTLVHRALTLAGRTAGVTVHKHIPAGAGLGGGSSNAAAVLRWCGWTDVAAASRLGADVSFCLVGGRARVTGIGEVVEPLPFERRTYTLLTPAFGCSTPAVYRAWDALGAPVGEHGNDLELAAVSVAPDLVRERDRLGDLSGHHPQLAGSGSTWFVEGAFESPFTIVVTTIPAY